MDKVAALAATKEKEKEKEKQKFLAKEREKRLARESSQLRSLTLKDITIKGKCLTFTRAGYTQISNRHARSTERLASFVSFSKSIPTLGVC